MDTHIASAPPSRWAWFVDRKSINVAQTAAPNQVGVASLPVRDEAGTRRKSSGLRWYHTLPAQQESLPNRCPCGVRDRVQADYRESYLTGVPMDRLDGYMQDVRFSYLRKDPCGALRQVSFYGRELPEVQRRSPFIGVAGVGEDSRADDVRVLKSARE
jgi:hypothetical protein